MAREGDPPLDALVVGAGFAGVMAGLELARTGRRFVILERGATVGGVWRDNVYPGCACDIPADLYSIRGRPNPDWRSTYPSQPEILNYVGRVAEESGLGPRLRFGFDVARLVYDDASGRWTALARDGRRAEARAAVLALGPQSRPKLPEIDGLDRYRGRIVHSARWPGDLELAGRRVGVVGTGASAVQIVPAIAPEVARLTVFQRSAPWILPRGDRAFGRRMRRLRARHPSVQRVSRAWSYWVHELFGLSFVGFGALHAALTAAARLKLRREVPDPALRRRLTPDHALGCKRVMVADDYWPAFTRPNVTLETAPIRRATPEGLETADGTRHALDVLICATGFSVADPDGFLRVEGAGGRVLEEVWRRGGARAYRGTTAPGFPNLLMLLGPNSGLGHSSALLTVESQLRYVLGYLDALDALPGGGALDVREEVEAAWDAELRRRLSRTVWASGCRSWYLDRDGRNAAIFPGLTRAFRRATARFDPEAYRVLPVRETIRAP